MGEIYHKLHEALRGGYKEIEIFRIFERVYQEHFTVVKNKVTVKKNEELHSGILQSPDDIDATYRKKGKKDRWGQSVNVTETANPPLSDGKSGFIRVIRTNEGRRQLVFKKLGSNWSKSAQYFPVCYFKVKTHWLSNFEIKYCQVA